MGIDNKIISYAVRAIKNVYIIKLFFFLFFITLLIFQNTRHIWDKLFWLDETTTYQVALLPVWQIPKEAATAGHMQPPIFYWLGHFMLYIGDDPIILRSLSVIFYIFTLWFIIFVFRELHLFSRFMMCFVIVTCPFTSYAAIEFRPYALSVFAIIVSSIFLYRMLQSSCSWKKSIFYGISALILQYSLTLNCFVFSVQMMFVFLYLFNLIRLKGGKYTLSHNYKIIIICFLLCFQYPLFLSTVYESGSRYSLHGSLLQYTEHLITNFKIFLDSLTPNSWVKYLIYYLFFSGLLYGFRRKILVLAYLLLILTGQILFSTFMTYSAISWFAPRYLVASYVAFFFICGLGAETLTYICRNKKIIAIVTIPLFFSLYTSMDAFFDSMAKSAFNPSATIIQQLRCTNRETIVVTVPRYYSPIPEYIYRNDSMVFVPGAQEDISEIIEKGLSMQACFILQEDRKHPLYTRKPFDLLKSLPNYTVTRHTGRKWSHVPGLSWLFTPAGDTESRNP